MESFDNGLSGIVPLLRLFGPPDINLFLFFFDIGNFTGGVRDRLHLPRFPFLLNDCGSLKHGISIIT